jgi:hypothetical protein
MNEPTQETTSDPELIEERPRLPVALYIIALQFFVGGLFGLANMIQNIGLHHFDFGVIGLYIGPALLFLKRPARMWALVFIWIALIAIPIVALGILIAPPQNVFIFWNGQRLDGNDPVVRTGALACCALVFAFLFWQYRKLTHPEVKALFEGVSSNRRQAGNA